jgi:hypothetical protein
MSLQTQQNLMLLCSTHFTVCKKYTIPYFYFMNVTVGSLYKIEISPSWTESLHLLRWNVRKSAMQLCPIETAILTLSRPLHGSGVLSSSCIVQTRVKSRKVHVIIVVD